MPTKRRLARPALALIAVAAVALVVSGCALFKPGSLTVSQPGGIGSVRIHFTLCTASLEGTEICGSNDETTTLQYLVGIAAPPGSVPPATFTATPVGGGAPMVFTRNEEVAPQLAANSGTFAKLLEEIGPPENPEEEQEKKLLEEIVGTAWPPSGLQGFGYLSAPVVELDKAKGEWSADADFGLPTAADGGPFAGPFATAIAYGVRLIDAEKSASRPVRCALLEEGSMPNPSEALCLGGVQKAQIGTADLRIAGPTKPVGAFVGGSGQLSYSLKYAGTPPAVPTFSLSGTTTAKGGKVKPASKAFTPAGPTAKSKVTVSVPKKTKPGTYQVTLNATTPQGGVATGVGKLKVTKPKIKFGGVKLNPGNGTATLKVKVPSGGKLTVSGKGVAKATKKSKKKKTLKVKIATKGSSSNQLETAGSLKVKIKAKFKPSSGIAVTKTKSIVLKQG
jgi:hypothetical protein